MGLIPSIDLHSYQFLNAYWKINQPLITINNILVYLFYIVTFSTFLQIMFFYSLRCGSSSRCSLRWSIRYALWKELFI